MCIYRYHILKIGPMKNVKEFYKGTAKFVSVDNMVPIWGNCLLVASVE